MISFACVLVVASGTLAGSSLLECTMRNRTQDMDALDHPLMAGLAQSQSSGTKPDSGKSSSGSSTKAGDKKVGTQKSGGSGSSKAASTPAAKASSKTAPKTPTGAAAKASPSQDGRPKFAPLFVKLQADCEAALDPQEAEMLRGIAAASKLADSSAPTMQVKFGRDVLEFLSNPAFLARPEERDDMTVEQRKAIQEWRKKEASADVSTAAQFKAELRKRLESLDEWIAASPDRQGTTLTLESKGVGRLGGYRSIPWGPIKEWDDQIVALKFGDGIAFERQSKLQSLPLAIRAAFMSIGTEWPTPLPPVDVLPGSIDVFVSFRPIEGLDGVQIVQRLLVVDGCLEGAVTAVIGEKEGSLMAAASTQWESVLKELGRDAEVVEVANVGQLLKSIVTWRGETGLVSALTLNENAGDQVALSKLVLASPEYTVAPSKYTVLPVTDSLQEGINEWVFDLDDLTIEQRRALIPRRSQMVVMVEMVAQGKDDSKFCKPHLTLRTSQGTSIEDVGQMERQAVIKGLGGNGRTIPFDLEDGRLAIIASVGMHASHGERTYVFYVPKDAPQPLSLCLEGCETAVPLPPLPTDQNIVRVPIDSRREVGLKDSVAQSSGKTFCMIVRQWSAGIIPRAEAAKVAAEQKAAQRKADREAASKQEAAESKRKREQAFE